VDHDHKVVQKLERFNNLMYIRLDLRKRALKNWGRLRVLLAIQKITGKNVLKIDENPFDVSDNADDVVETDFEPEKKAGCSLNALLLPYIFKKTNIYYLTWQVFFGVIVCFAIADDVFIMGFKGYPLIAKDILDSQTYFSLVLMANIIIEFFKEIEERATI
jgi:hypothetical protein